MPDETYEQIINAVRLRLAEYKWELDVVLEFRELEIPVREKPTFGGTPSNSITIQWNALVRATHTQTWEIRQILFTVKRIRQDFIVDVPHQLIRAPEA
jgi:hypothetical protein